MRMYLDDFLGVFVVVVFVWLWVDSAVRLGLGTYLGQLWMTLDNNNNNNIHSMVVGDVGSSGSRYVNVRRDLPGLCCYTLIFFCQMYEFKLSGFSKIHSVFHNLRSISSAFFSSPDLTDDDDHYFTQ